MINNRRKLVKVTMEYENGDKVYIEGEDAKIWQDAMNGAITRDYTHGAHCQEMLKNVNWKKL